MILLPVRPDLSHDRGRALDPFTLHRLVPSAQMFGEEFFDTRREIHIVRRTNKPVAFVGVKDISRRFPRSRKRSVRMLLRISEQNLARNEAFLRP
jgi:hypothetical protein